MGMTKAELKLGGIYSNGKKRETIRKIVEFVACPVYLNEGPCVRYLVLKGLRPEVGNEYTITRGSFAKWAHHRVVE